MELEKWLRSGLLGLCARGIDEKVIQALLSSRQEQTLKDFLDHRVTSAQLRPPRNLFVAAHTHRRTLHGRFLCQSE